ncbi:MAG: GtrA family protein [Saprospiraceae bacterium]|nr:GtrA family protein [Saprospiraceae bacterium]
MDSINKIFSFSIIGGMMTFLSLSSNIILLKYFKTPLILTHIVVYFITILISYVINSKFTYRSGLNLKKSIIFFSIYLGTMLLGSMIYYIIPGIVCVPNWYYPFFVLPFTSMINYLLNDKYLKNDIQLSKNNQTLKNFIL